MVRKGFVLVIVLLMILISLTACNSKNKHNEIISIVYNGHFNGFRDRESIGKTFDKFFKNTKWDSYGDDRPTLVGFFGILELDDVRIGVGCQFKIYMDDSFELIQVMLGENERLYNEEISDFIDIIYNN